MLTHKCSYKKNIRKVRKQQKNKEKVELKFAIYQKQGKGKFPAEYADI